MTPTSLIVVADRGSLKAYKVNETPNRGPSLQMVKAFDITDAHGRYNEKLTDQAGRFPSAPGANGGHHMNAMAERQGIESEIDRRILKDLAENIGRIVEDEKPQGWSFAAPSAIHAAIVDLIPAAARNRIVEHVHSDLVKIEPSKLSSHFRSLQPL